MKKVFSLLLIIVLAVSVFSLTPSAEVGVASADEAGVLSSLNLSGDCNAYEFLCWFVTAYPDRSTGTPAEVAAANGLATLLAEMGLAPAAANGTFIDAFNFPNPLSSGDTVYSQNVVGQKAAATETQQTVILGAHYDNLTSVASGEGTTYGGDGTFDNGTGVATLLATLHSLLGVDLPFNLKVVFFGSEETGLFGSAHYTDEMTASEKDNLLLYVDFNMVGGGDYLYLYCDEVKTECEDFLTGLAGENGLDVHSPPSNKEIISAEYVDGLPYGHIGVASDVASFLSLGVNCAHLFGYNWEIKNTVEGKEFASRANVVGTDDDTLAYFNKFCLETGKKHMNDASSLVVLALTDGDFVATAISSKENKYDYSILTDVKTLYIVLAVAFVLVLAAALLTWFFLKRKVTPEDSVKEQQRIASIYEKHMREDEEMWRRLRGESPEATSAPKKENPFDDFPDEDGDGKPDVLPPEEDDDNPFDGF